MRKHWLIIIVSVFFGYGAQAQESLCRPGDKTLHSCISAVQPFDQEIAAKHFLETDFCQSKEDKTQYVVVSDFGENQEKLPLVAQVTKPATRYQFGLDGLKFEMRINSIVGLAVNSKLIVTYTNEYKPSSSFDCR